MKVWSARPLHRMSAFRPMSSWLHNSELWLASGKHPCTSLATSFSLISGYHPQTNGQTERANQTLEKVLRCVCSTNPTSWSSMLPWVEYAVSSHTASASDLSPFECCMGYQPPLFPSQEKEVGLPSAEAFIRRCRRMWLSARRALVRVGQTMKTAADKRRRPAPRYRVGQKVWLAARDILRRVESRKLAPRFLGPYPIIRIISPETSTAQKEGGNTKSQPEL